jgi:hypothetical protein
VPRATKAKEEKPDLKAIKATAVRVAKLVLSVLQDPKVPKATKVNRDQQVPRATKVPSVQKARLERLAPRVHKVLPEPKAKKVT